MSLPESLEILPLGKPPDATIVMPGSKSITNRALVLAALTAKGFACVLRGALRSADTEVMIEALRVLGFRVLTEWTESIVCVSSGEDEPTIPARGADLIVADSGTAMRFLTALVSLGHGKFRLDGSPRMRQRPIEDLLDALRQLGVVAYSEQNNSYPPVIVEADGLKGGRAKLKGNISSQFLSGLLLVAPFASEEVIIDIAGPLVSLPYVYMTAQMLGLKIDHPDDIVATCALHASDAQEWRRRIAEQTDGTCFRIRGRQQQSEQDYLREREASAIREGVDPRRHTWLRDYHIEPDASAAGYFFGAAAIIGGTVTIPHLDKQSLQGDIRFVEVLADMGCEIDYRAHGLVVTGGPLFGIDVDMNDISDCVMTLAVVACFAEGPTTIRNVAHIRHKESDRLHALATELRRVGAGVEEFTDGVTITPQPLHGAAIETYNDHRMAMSMALIGLKVPGIIILNPGCVAKTYPDFFLDLEKLR